MRHSSYKKNGEAEAPLSNAHMKVKQSNCYLQLQRRRNNRPYPIDKKGSILSAPIYSVKYPPYAGAERHMCYLYLEANQRPPAKRDIIYTTHLPLKSIKSLLGTLALRLYAVSLSSPTIADGARHEAHRHHDARANGRACNGPLKQVCDC